MWAASFKSLYPKRPANTIQRHTCLGGAPDTALGLIITKAVPRLDCTTHN